MSSPTQPAGWYPDDLTGGTKFWSGTQWTGDTRPPRRPFAASSSHLGWGVGLTILGALFLFTSPTQLTDPSPDATTSPVAAFLLAIVMGAAMVAAGIYLWRGQGPTTKSVLNRLREEELAQVARQTSSGLNSTARASGAATPVHITVTAPPGDTVGAARVQAIADPDTAHALENLEKLLYTRVITDEEYAAAKQNLFGTDQ